MFELTLKVFVAVGGAGTFDPLAKTNSTAMQSSNLNFETAARTILVGVVVAAVTVSELVPLPPALVAVRVCVAFAVGLKYTVVVILPEAIVT